MVWQPPLGVLAVVAACIHLTVLGVSLRTGAADAMMISPDSHQYVRLAGYMVTEGEFTLDGREPSARREPGYPAFLAAFMLAKWVAPHQVAMANLWPVAVVQIVLYGWACWLLARQAARMFGGMAALLCLLFTQGYWVLSRYQYDICSEAVTMVFLAAAWTTIGTWSRLRESWSALIWAAACLGLACVTKSILVLWVPVMVGFAWWRGRVPVSRVVAFAVIALVLPAAWTARNYRVFGEPIMGSIDGVSSFYRGNVIPFVHIPDPADPAMPEEAVEALAERKGDLDKYRWFKQESLQIVREHPVRYVLQVLHRAVYMLIDFDLAQPRPWHRALVLVKNDQFLIMLVLGLQLHLLLRRGGFYIESGVLLLVFSLGVYSLIYGVTRYIMPAVYVMAPLYAFAAGNLLVAPVVRRWMPEGGPPVEGVPAAG